MAGLYLHIPFCRKRCHYCDFYKTTEVRQKPLFLEMVVREAELQAQYLGGESLETLYFGGGTPSVLTPEEVRFLMEKAGTFFCVEKEAEVTMEVNPDDMTPGKAALYRAAGVNRLSIGIQSFHDHLLKVMNRRHNGRQSREAVTRAAEEGFDQISLDLIFGLPGMTLREWEESLDQALALPVNHISAYHLTYHEGTPFYDRLLRGTLTEAAEEESLEQFSLLMDKTRAAGFEQYEISNFALNGAYSRHNSAYWSGRKYLGLGPSAHSYNGMSRQWNRANLSHYLHALEKGTIPAEMEILTPADRLNDYLITRLRTRWGISMAIMARDFGDAVASAVMEEALPFLEEGTLVSDGDILRLSPAGIMVSDRILLALIREKIS